MTAIQTYIANTNSDNTIGRMAFLLGTITEEITEELNEKNDAASLEQYLGHIGLILEWVGHGVNSALPPHLQGFAEMIQPTQQPLVATAPPEAIATAEVLVTATARETA